MFGAAPPPQNETTPFIPRSPYACAKVFAHQLCQNYRDAYGMFICVRHPVQPRVAAPRDPVRDAQDHARGGAHQARPRQEALPRQPRRQARLGLRRRLRRGDVADAAAGQARRLRDRHRRVALRCASSCDVAFGALDLDWKKYVEIDPRYFRPTEVDHLHGDPGKARSALGWKPKVTFKAADRDDGARRRGRRARSSLARARAPTS